MGGRCMSALFLPFHFMEDVLVRISVLCLVILLLIALLRRWRQPDLVDQRMDRTDSQSSFSPNDFPPVFASPFNHYIDNRF